jgi:hypothetical protein
MTQRRPGKDKRKAKKGSKPVPIEKVDKLRRLLNIDEQRLANTLQELKKDAELDPRSECLILQKPPVNSHHLNVPSRLRLYHDGPRTPLSC